MNQPQLGPWELASRQGKLPHTADMHRGNAVEGHQACGVTAGESSLHAAAKYSAGARGAWHVLSWDGGGCEHAWVVGSTGGFESQLCHLLWDVESPALSEPLFHHLLQKNDGISWGCLGIK